MREFMDAVPQITSLDRSACRDHAQARFSSQIMADRYESLYAEICEPSGNGRLLAHEPRLLSTAPFAQSQSQVTVTRSATRDLEKV
jgi:hypothetical protein